MGALGAASRACNRRPLPRGRARRGARARRPPCAIAAGAATAAGAGRFPHAMDCFLLDRGDPIKDPEGTYARTPCARLRRGCASGWGTEQSPRRRERQAEPKLRQRTPFGTQHQAEGVRAKAVVCERLCGVAAAHKPGLNCLLTRLRRTGCGGHMMAHTLANGRGGRTTPCRTALTEMLHVQR